MLMRGCPSTDEKLLLATMSPSSRTSQTFCGGASALALVLLGMVTSALAADAQSPDAFIATDPMSVDRHWHTATLLRDGRVLIAGGVSVGRTGNTYLASAEIYNPAA